MGPARSESSIMCWDIGARGLRTVSVYFIPICVSLRVLCSKVWERERDEDVGTRMGSHPSDQGRGKRAAEDGIRAVVSGSGKDCDHVFIPSP